MSYALSVVLLLVAVPQQPSSNDGEVSQRPASKAAPAAPVDDIPDVSREAELSAAADMPADKVLVQLFEGIPAKDNWPKRLPAESLRYSQATMAFVGFPKKYTATGVIDDRSNPFYLRARAKLVCIAATSGQHEFVLRSKGATRLFVDGKLLAQTDFLNRNSSGHEAVPDVVGASRDDLRPLPPGCQEKIVVVTLEPGEHVVRLDAFVGGKGLRLELDELCVAVARSGEKLRLVSPVESAIAVTEEAWLAHSQLLQADLDEMDRRHRRQVAGDWTKYWERRHEYARHVVGQLPAIAVPAVPANMPIHNEVDAFVGAKLAEAGVEPAPPIDDLAFLRRVTLDTVGVLPARREISEYLAADSRTRRASAIDRLLNDTRWADHWVGYWQDVLAENPGILKPELNNSGPFRWWIYESLRDNKPFDQFASELALMEGSVYYGGPAGFGLATQNDAPLAAKAHVLAKAFLAIDMHCARCHDAPYHPFKQEQLFGIAAMLNRKPLKLPKTSTVPLVEGARKPLVKISLAPGQEIAPAWPLGHTSADEFPKDLIRHADDPREQVAIQLTSPHNDRFAKVIVNRVWRRLMGRGLIEPVDDWESAQRQLSHPELLDYLAREFVNPRDHLHPSYDLKHLTRLILNSHAYQRQIRGGAAATAPELFASPVRRKMTAEQLVDSLFAISGKEFHAEQLTLDPEGRRSVDTFLNLGVPRRAWQFTSLSNERDRPALALPNSQSIVDLLVTFGWRDARPNPITYRDEDATPLQPLTLANGVAGNRAIRLSDDSAWTELCLQDRELDELIDELFLRVFTRHPAEDERSMMRDTLAEGYELRRTGAPLRLAAEKRSRNAVSWSNHLSEEATRIKQELERAVRAGDPPTNRIQSQWRERVEDALWAMLNSPEFVFVP